MPVADVEILPCAKRHGRQAQDLHSREQRALGALRLREPHQGIAFQTAREGAWRRACMVSVHGKERILSNPGYRTYLVYKMIHFVGL